MGKPWPYVRRTLGNSGATADPGPRNNPTLEWKHDARARIFGTPIIDEERLYVGTCAQAHWDDIGCVVAVDLSTGERAWMGAEQAMEVRGTPGLANGKLYVGGLDGNGFILDATDGGILTLDENIGASPADGVCPLVQDGTVYTTPYNLEARDAETWSLQWTLGGEESDLFVEEPPAIHNGTVVTACMTNTGQREYVGQSHDCPMYVQVVDPSLKTVDADTGSVRWTRSLPGRARSPAIREGVAYLATWGSQPQGQRFTAVKPCSDEQPVPDEAPTDYHEFGTVHAIDVETGAEYWSHRLEEPVKTMPAVYQDTVCVGTTAGTVAAFDTTTGECRWKTQVNDGERVSSWPTIGADTVYVGSRDECLYALDRRDGSIRWQFDTAAAVDSNPSVVGETVYVGDNAGHVYAITSQ